MRVLITIGSGSLGVQLVKMMSEDPSNEIVAVETEDIEHQEFDRIGHNLVRQQCDLSDLAELLRLSTNMDLIIHAAEFRSFAKRDKDRLFEINQQGTQHIVDCCVANGVNQLLYVSDVAALGADRGRLLNEDDIWMEKPLTSVFSQSKYLGEQEIWRGQAEGLSINIVAHSTVMSPSLLDKGYYPGGATGIVSEQDVVDIVKVLVNRGLDGEKYICSAHNMTYKEICEQHKNRGDLNIDLSPLRPWRAKLRSRFDMGGNHNVMDISDSESNLKYDNQKSIEQLQFNYRDVNQTFGHTAV